MDIQRENAIHRCVDVLLLNVKNEVLLLQRKDSDSLFPGTWCLPGGHIDKNEAIIDAAFRELEEETGIYAHDLHKVGTYDYKNGYTTVLWIGIEVQDFVIGKMKLSVNEHQDAKWVPLEKIFEYKLMGDLGKMIKELVIEPNL